MKKLIVRALAITLALFLLCGGAALGESKYVSIKDIRDTIPERWTYEVTSVKGDTVKIDTPIVVPQVDTVPIVRITWGGPYEAIADSPDMQVMENDLNGFFVYHPYPYWNGNSDQPLHDVSVGNVAYEDAPETLLFQLRCAFPALRQNDFECYYQAAYVTADDSDGYYWLSYYPLYHGIAYLIGQCYWGDAKGESVGKLPSVPYNGVDAALHTADEYTALIGAPKELGMDVEDVPLLPLNDILTVFERRAQEGYIYSLSELRFGYMAFIDPAKKGDEFVLMPVWAGRGVTRSYLSNPFFPQSTDESKASSGFHSIVNVVVNAQTGEAYEFFYDTTSDRRYVPKIITWDDVK
ncbi:MAG: hypothetical protein PHY12_00830 [Eubacteriales bacterium]|nr:hypothetical protein [Eubacteriales bacterium]